MMELIDKVYSEQVDQGKRISAVELSNATYVQHSAEIARQIESVRVGHSEYRVATEKKFEDVSDKTLTKTELMLEKLENRLINHINYTQGLQKKDIEKSREDCEAENKKIYDSVALLDKKVVAVDNKVGRYVFGFSAACAAISVIWVLIKEII